MQLLEKKHTQQKLHDVEFASDLLDMTQATKVKINKFNLIKIKIFYT